MYLVRQHLFLSGPLFSVGLSATSDASLLPTWGSAVHPLLSLHVGDQRTPGCMVLASDIGLCNRVRLDTAVWQAKYLDKEYTRNPPSAEVHNPMVKLYHGPVMGKQTEPLHV